MEASDGAGEEMFVVSRDLLVTPVELVGGEKIAAKQRYVGEDKQKVV